MPKPSSGSEGISLRVVGDLSPLARRFARAAGPNGLQRELERALNRAGRPLVSAARRGALETLPRRGGLASQVAGSRFATSIDTTKGSVSLRLTVSSPHNLAGMNRGFLRHPVFGNRKVWVSQSIRPHWFDRFEGPAEIQAKRAMLQAVEKVARDIR